MENNLVPKEEFNVIIGNNVKIFCHNQLQHCDIGNLCLINSSFLDNIIIGNNVSVSYSYALDSIVQDNAKIGVFSHLRKGSKILNGAKIGNFVETKNCVVGENSKASHLTYIGDAEIGNNVNIGCGTIFCNYNGKIKQKTIVGNNVFVGSNSNLVAPLKIEDNAFIAAGSTITENVPECALAIARARQINKLNYIKEK